MNNGIELEGFEETEDLIKNMVITEEDEKRAMRAALNSPKKKLVQDTPKGFTKRLSKVKMSIKKDGFATVGIIKLGAWWDKFQEFGTSQQKHHAGFFDRSINSTTDEFMKILYEELLKNKGR